MAIKINGQDLLKRFINGQEIVRVYKNGGQIRPETVPPIPEMFCLTAEQDNSSVRVIKVGSPTDISLEISYNKTSWSDYTWDYQGLGPIIYLNTGDKLYMRNKSETPKFSYNSYNYYTFQIGGKVGASGDVDYLLCKQSTKTLSSGATFYRLFEGCTGLTTAPQLLATTLWERCYRLMFKGCTSLVTAPELPATTLAEFCYDSMFEGCTSLVNAPELPCMSIPREAYERMFKDCTSLVVAPSLPATAFIGGGCYEYMFEGCTSLESIPRLPITDVKASCYYRMFAGCTSLGMLPSLAGTDIPNYAYQEMFSGCSSIKLSTTQEGEYQTPYRIPTELNGGAGNQALYQMFSGTGGTFTGTPSINTTYYTSNQVI